MRGLLSNPSLALESIQFQSLELFSGLTAIFQDAKSVTAKDLRGHELSRMAETLINKKTNLDIEMTFDDYMPCVEFPDVDRNHPFLQGIFRAMSTSEDGLRILDRADHFRARGTVDLKNARVSGVFTQFKANIHLPVDMLSGTKYTAEEIAAMTLHEIGHIFTYFEYINRSMMTNVVLAGISKVMDGSDTPAQREVILARAKDVLDVKDLDVKTLADTSSKEAVATVLITNVGKKAESELGSNVYDFTTWEYMSDQFATRHGAGRALVTALDKLHRQYGHISFRSMPVFLFWEAVKLSLVALSFLSAGTGNPYFNSMLTHILVVLVARDSQGDGTYDTPEDRFKRVRNQIVEALKDQRISPADNKRLQADLKAVNDILQYVNDRRQLFGVIWDFVWRPAARARDQKLLQKELEDLAANDLFAKAAEFRLHA